MRREDRALAAREPELPGLALLLDDEAFAAVMRERLPDAGILAARGRYVRHKPGTNCLVAFELETASGTQLAYARAERPGEQAKLAKTRTRATASTALGVGGVTFADEGVTILGFPNDRALPALRRLAGGRRTLEVLAYKPERRLVARRGRRVVKLYTEDRFAAARGAAAALPAAAAPRLQRCIGADERRRLLEFAWIDGTPLDARLAEPGGAKEAGEAGATLRALHDAVPAAPLRRRTARDQRGALLAAASAAGVAGAGVERAARALAERVAPLLDGGGAAPRLLHGDFSADQVLVSREGVVLADLDGAVLGDPADDLGSALADLELRVLEQRLGADAAGAAADALTAAVDGGRDRLAAFTAAGLLRRAAEPFRRRRSGWDVLVEAAVARAAELAPLRPAPRAAPRRSNGARPATGAAPRRSNDAEDVLAALGSLALPSGRAVLRRAWPRPGGQLLLEYRAPGGTVVGAQWSPGEGDLAEERSRTRRAGLPAPVLAEAAPGVRVLVHRGGADRRLPGLHRALAVRGSRLLAHRPTRRAAVALPGGSTFVKVVRPERAVGVALGLRQAAQLARGAFAVPAVEAVDPALGTVACVALPGRALSGLLDTPEGQRAAAALGGALRAFHAGEPPGDLPRHGVADELALLRRFTTGLAPYAPLLAAAAEVAAGAVAERLAALPPGRPAALHRDLHDKQVLVDESGSIGVIDFDTLAAGDPALDLGNLIAHLELRALQGRCSPAAAERLAGALLGGYAAGPDLRRRVSAYVAATRVRLACVYAVRPAWPALPAALLAAAASDAAVDTSSPAL